MQLQSDQLPIIMTSMSHHDHLSSAAISLARELSKSQPVFYINPPFTLTDYFFRRIKRRSGTTKFYSSGEQYPNLTIVEPPLVLPINFLPKGAIYNVFSRLNNYIFNKSIKLIFSRHAIPSQQFIFFNSFNPFYGRQLPHKYKPVLKVYQSRDDIASAPFVNKHGVVLELEAIKKADLIFATSTQLTKKLSGLSGREVFHLPNAVNVGVFSRAFVGEAIASGIIGYIGEVETRVDLDLLKKIARAFPGKLVIIFGPCPKDIIKLFKEVSPNVVFGGMRKLEDLPLLAAHFECAIIPFKKNELTRHIYPLKLNEYLALGLPVISTDFSEDLKDFNEIAYIAKNDDQFIECISKACIEDNPVLRTKRREIALQNSWTARVRTLHDTWTNFINE